MSKTDDLLKRAQVTVTLPAATNKYQDFKLKAGESVIIDYSTVRAELAKKDKIIHELLDKIKGDAERFKDGGFQIGFALEIGEILKKYKVEDDDFLSMEIAQAAINVIKGDDNDR